MNKSIILKFLMQDMKKNKKEYSEEDLLLFDEINKSVMEMEVAQSLFNSVSEDNLIDLAIHTEDVAISRYNYLIAMAKKRALKKIN